MLVQNDEKTHEMRSRGLKLNLKLSPEVMQVARAYEDWYTRLLMRMSAKYEFAINNELDRRRFEKEHPDEITRLLAAREIIEETLNRLVLLDRP